MTCQKAKEPVSDRSGIQCQLVCDKGTKVSPVMCLLLLDRISHSKIR